jgi:hypothetical protein
MKIHSPAFQLLQMNEQADRNGEANTIKRIKVFQKKVTALVMRITKKCF